MNALEGWSSFTVEQCCDILDSMRVPVNAEDRDKRIGEIPYYGANGLQGYIDDFIFDEPLILIAEDGGCFDEFATRPIAYRITGKSWVNNHAHVLRVKEAFCQDAVFYNLEHKDIQSFIVGGTRSKLNQIALRAITLALPTSKPEQTKIAKILLTVDRAIEQTEALIAKQQRIKTGLMQDLLTRGIDEHGNLRSEQTHKFKDSPLGRIPEEWNVVPLLSFASKSPDSFVNGPFGSDLLCSELQSEGVPVIYIRDIKPGAYQRVSTVHVTQTKADQLAACNVHYGDILVAKVGDPPCDTAPYIHRERAIVTQDVIRIRPSKEVVSYFLSHLINSHVGRKAVKEIVIQGTRARVSLTEFKTLKLPKPHREEQNLIAKALESIQQDIQKKQFGLDKLRLLKNALMQDLLTGKKRVTSLLVSELKN